MSHGNPPAHIPEGDYTWQAVRSQGAGGQNVNKVATAVHLRYDIHHAQLPDGVKQRLLSMKDRRITPDGVIIIKAQRHRRQEKNLDEALSRLHAIVALAWHPPKKRRPTRPTRQSKEKRLQHKKRRSRIKALRRGAMD
jgi:ribosome-associated protein